MAEALAKSLGRNVARYRKQAGLSQEDLAGRIGVWPAAVSRLETGTATPSIETLSKVAKAVGVTLSDLFDFDDFRGERDAALADLNLLLKTRRPGEIRKLTEAAKALFGVPRSAGRKRPARRK